MSIPNTYDFTEEEVLNLKDGEFHVLDVRTYEEFKESHINSTQHIPLDELIQRVDELPKNKTILVYCRSGKRSQQASDLLKQQGYITHNIGSFFNFSEALISKLN